MMRIMSGYSVFTSTQQPRKVVQTIRKSPGVVRAESIYWTIGRIAFVDGEDSGSTDAVIGGVSEVF